MIIFNLIVFFNVKVSLFSYLFDAFMSSFSVLVVNLFAVVFCLFCLFSFLIFLAEVAWVIFLGVIP